MKAKQPKKLVRLPPKTPPMEGTAANSDAEIPPGLEFLAKLKNLSPLQQTAAIAPKFAEALKTENAPEITDAFAGLFYGAGVDLGVPLPEWAKTASKKFWQGSGFDFFSELAEAKPEAVGKFIELMNLTHSGSDSSPAEEAIFNFASLIKNDVGNFSPDELLKFAKGRKTVPKIIEKAKNPTERLIIFIRIACAWRQVEKLGSHVKTHQWLLDNKIISEYTDRAETARFFREIDLPKGKAGRPKKIRTVKK